MNSKPIFRNPDKVQVLPWRDWMRVNCPTPGQGLVVEDLDLVVLRYGPLEGRPRDADGKFLFMEVKCKGASVGYAQQRVFGLIDRLLKKADPNGAFYIGYFVLHWFDDYVAIGGKRMSLPEFKTWLLQVNREPVAA